MKDEHVKDGHVKDKHVKDAAHDGSVKAFIFSSPIFQRRNPRLTHACRPKRLSLCDT